MEQHVAAHLDWLLRNNQMDLAELSRDRLQEIIEGLLHGQVLTFSALAAETRQSAVIAAQREMIAGLQQQLEHANSIISMANSTVAALENEGDLFYRDLVLTLANVASDSENGSLQEHLMTGIWRGVSRAIEQGDIPHDEGIGLWWSRAATNNFGFGQEEQVDDGEEGSEASAEDDGGGL